MKLALAAVLAGDTTGCHVQFLDDGTFADARYTAKVQELADHHGLRFGYGHLAMVDRQAEPPEIVYRAGGYHLVVRLAGREAVLYRPGLDDGQDWLHRAHRLVDARPDEERRTPLKAGDTVVTHRGTILDDGTLELDVLDLAVAGRPVHPERLHAATLPRIGAIYGAAALGG